MTAVLLLLPAVVVGAFVLLFATTSLERVIGLRRSDRWPLPRDVDVVPVLSADPTFPSQP